MLTCFKSCNECREHVSRLLIKRLVNGREVETTSQSSLNALQINHRIDGLIVQIDPPGRSPLCSGNREERPGAVRLHHTDRGHDSRRALSEPFVDIRWNKWHFTFEERSHRCERISQVVPPF